MKLEKPTNILKYLKQFLLLVALIYAFSNCQIKKSVLHFAGIESVVLSQKSLTQLPFQGSCTVNILHKNLTLKKTIAATQIPSLHKLKCFSFQTKEKEVFNALHINPAFEFNKSSASFPPIFIVFKNLKIAPRVVSYTA